ncbi:MAG: hypothetical protein KBC64_03735 [Simkaniaceae bacterium]|nr:hypothetical protein [Simkaniaceae bacterium]
MLIVSRTPVRLSFFGGGTDYPDYYLREKGAVLGTTINQYTHVSLNTISPFFEHKIRIGYSKTELVKTIDEIQHPSIRECLRASGLDANLDIHIFSDLPAKTGLGSSSSFTVGFLKALSALQGKVISSQSLAEQALYIEQKQIGENVGSQDQFHAAFGGLNIIEFSKDRVLVRPVIIHREKKALLEESMLVFFTGMTRFASDILDEQMEKTRNFNNDLYLQHMYDMVFEAEELLSETSPKCLIESFGHLLDKGWQLKRQLSGKISNPSIDEAYARGLAAGAYGGKLCGAGGGGFLLFLAPKALHNQIEKTVNLLRVNFSFEQEGAKIIYMKD